MLLLRAAPQSKGKPVHNCPNASFWRWTLMRTQGKFYFKDAITPKQKTIMAFMWQSLILSVICAHCLYPPQSRKLRVFSNMRNTTCQHLVFTVILTPATRATTTIHCCVWTNVKFRRLRTQTCWHEQTQQLYFFCSESWLVLFHTFIILLHLHKIFILALQATENVSHSCLLWKHIKSINPFLLS